MVDGDQVARQERNVGKYSCVILQGDVANGLALLSLSVLSSPMNLNQISRALATVITRKSLNEQQSKP